MLRLLGSADGVVGNVEPALDDVGRGNLVLLDGASEHGLWELRLAHEDVDALSALGADEVDPFKRI